MAATRISGFQAYVPKVRYLGVGCRQQGFESGDPHRTRIRVGRPESNKDAMQTATTDGRHDRSPPGPLPPLPPYPSPPVGGGGIFRRPSGTRFRPSGKSSFWSPGPSLLWVGAVCTAVIYLIKKEKLCHRRWGGCQPKYFKWPLT